MRPPTEHRDAEDQNGSAFWRGVVDAVVLKFFSWIYFAAVFLLRRRKLS